MPKKWIVEMDESVRRTSFFAIEAETIDDANKMAKTGKIEPLYTETWDPTGNADFTDSHEAVGPELELFKDQKIRN